MKQKKEELVSLNSEVTEFELQELESRLETDPLAVGGLVDMISTGNTSFDLASSDECYTL
jgi:hypothetical protein